VAKLLGALFAALLAIAGSATAAWAQDESGQGTQPWPAGSVVAITFRDQADANRLAAHLDVWEVDHQAHTLVAYVTPNELATLRQEGYAVATVEAPKAASIPNFACYRTVEETYADLAQLANDAPDLARWIDIGDSWLKVQSEGTDGYDLRALVLTNRALPGPKPRLFVMGAIHARELTTAETVTRFAEQLVAGYGKDAEATWLLDYNEIHLLPQANPDGRKRAELNAEGPAVNPNALWRKNVNDTLCVDLNRNHSFRWNGCESDFGGWSLCSSEDPCSLTYRGTAPGSEPETQAIEAYLRSLFLDRRDPGNEDAAPADTQGVVISLHSYSELVLFPWGWRPTPAPNDAELRTLGRKFGYFTNYQVCQSGEPGCIYQTDGSTDDFSYGELGVASYTFEMGTEFFQECSTFESDIVTEMLAALTYAAKAAVRPYQLPAGPDVRVVSLQPAKVKAGAPVTLTVQIDDTRRYSDTQFGGDPIEAIKGAAYTVDAPFWCGSAGQPVPLKPLDRFDSPSEGSEVVISTRGWAPGRHTIFVSGADAAGNQGPPSAVFVDVGNSTTLQQRGCVEHQYLPIIAVSDERSSARSTADIPGASGIPQAVGAGR
jgi:hypothetical protein